MSANVQSAKGTERKPGRRAGRDRVPIERMHYIARRLRDLQPFTCTQIAKRFETKRKTVLRDIAFMRDRLGWDIAYNGTLQSYELLSAPEPVL